MIRTITKTAQSIFVDRRSKFIANAFEVSSVQEAREMIQKMRNRYYNARHNCYAYRVLEKDSLVERQSDDGEPSGTAGGPILNILKKKELTNILIVVTRYFGGTFLGTGGLVRAYTTVSDQVIQNAGTINKEKGYVVEVLSDYDIAEEFLYFCRKNNINVIYNDYLETVVSILEISQKKYEEIFKRTDIDNYHNLPKTIKGYKYIPVEE